MLHFFWIIFGPLFVFVAMPFAYWRQARKAWRGRIGEVPEREFTISDEGVSIVDKGAPAQLAWADFRKVAETPEFMLFFLTAREAIYCPIDALPGETLESFRGIVRRHAGDRAEFRTEAA